MIFKKDPALITPLNKTPYHKRGKTLNNGEGKYTKLNRAEILREMRLDRNDKVKILSYATAKGIQDKDTRQRLTQHIEEILKLEDAHNFSYHAFLVENTIFLSINAFLGHY